MSKQWADLSHVMSKMVFFVLSFFQRDDLDDIFKLIESVSEGFSTYSCIDAVRCPFVINLEAFRNYPAGTLR